MKKGLLSVIIILCTIISCTFMLTYDSPDKSSSQNPGYNITDKTDIKPEEKAEEKTEETKDEDDKKQDSDISKQEDETPINDPAAEEAKSVFKVSVSSISISATEKLKLLLIYKKLDREDQDRISEYLSEQDEDSVKSIFHILRDRLQDDDYKTVRDIASRFINLDVAEN